MTAEDSKIFRLTEVAEHNKSKGEDKSIWTVIHDKVYDITKFLDEVSKGLKEFIDQKLFLSILVERRY